MRPLTALVITVMLGFTPVLNAGVLEGSYIIDRPSSEHPKLPEFMPKNLPSFTLPPVEKVLLPQAQHSTLKIKLNGVKFIGNTVISDAALQKIAQPFIGKVLSSIELEELRLKVSQYYVQQGYINSGALLPDQPLNSGIVSLQIIEGRLSDIHVTGVGWLNPSYISQRLYDTEQVLDINQLRDNFQLLLLDPLIEQMNGSLIPSSQRGTSVLAVDVQRARAYQLTLSADNYNPPSIGSEVGHLSGWIKNLSSWGDTLSGSVAYSDGLLGGSGGYSIPLNASNSRFNFHFDRNNAVITEPTLKALNIKSRYASYEFGLTHPLIQSLTRNFNVGIQFNFKNNRTSLLGEAFNFSEGAVNGRSKDSVLRFSLDFTERLEQQVFSARSITSVGINAFSPTLHQGLGIADGLFVSWLGQMQYAAQLFSSDTNLLLRGDVQYSDNRLMTLERFALGGRYSVRGYRENELVRDKGYVVSAELRYPLFKKTAEGNVLGQVTLFPFMDYGVGQNRGDRKNARTLHSVGIGLNWQPFEQVNTEIIYAHPLRPATPKADYNLQDSGIHWHVNISAF